MIKSILRVGIPTGVESGMFEAGKLVVMSIIATFSTAAITANAVTNSLNALTYAAGIAVGMTMITVVGQTMGAGRAAEAKHYMIKMTGFGMILMLLLNVAIIVFRRQIVSLYDLTPGTAELAMKLILICCIGTIAFWGPGFILPNGLRAVGDVRFTMVVATVSMWTVVWESVICSVSCALSAWRASGMR
jgi:Na+-driven multidrug efflux pump